MAEFGVNQTEIALHTNVKQQTISNWIKGTTEPGITDLLAIHKFFGISVDALLLVNIENGNILTKEHINYFKKNGKVGGNVLGKVQSISKEYFVDFDSKLSLLNEDIPTLNWAVMSLLRQISEKIDTVKVSVDSIVKK